jgi:hypothetical protein
MSRPLARTVTIVSLVKPNSCDQDTISSIESVSFTSIGTAGPAVEVLARRRSVDPHFVFFLPTPESYIVLHIFVANVATFRSYVETFVTFSTFALCYGYEFTVFALWYCRNRYNESFEWLNTREASPKAE